MDLAAPWYVGSSWISNKGQFSLKTIVVARVLAFVLVPWTLITIQFFPVFPVVMYGYESWTIKKAEHRRIDAFELWCWRRLLRVPWTARRSNQSILMEISPGCYWTDWCWSWSSNTLATSCEELTHWKRLWCWEGLGTGVEGDDRGWDGWMASPTQWAWVWLNSGSWWWTGRPGMLWFMGWQRVGQDWATELSWYVIKYNIINT